eukprot:1189585-Prorocentrum_minimum.AAC.3
MNASVIRKASTGESLSFWKSLIEGPRQGWSTGHEARATGQLGGPASCGLVLLEVDTIFRFAPLEDARLCFVPQVAARLVPGLAHLPHPLGLCPTSRQIKHLEKELKERVLKKVDVKPFLSHSTTGKFNSPPKFFGNHRSEKTADAFSQRNRRGRGDSDLRQEPVGGGPGPDQHQAAPAGGLQPAPRHGERGEPAAHGGGGVRAQEGARRGHHALRRADAGGRVQGKGSTGPLSPC